MKKFLALLLTLTLVFSLAACGEKTDTPANEDQVEVLLFIHGTLGDLSFFDSAARGIDMINDKYGDEVQTKIVEAGSDNTKWESALLDEADKGYDIIFLGTWEMIGYVMDFAPDYPETDFIMFDEGIDFTAGDYENVFCIKYAQNEGSFLAGALAAKMTETNKIGFLGGAPYPVINDFLVGYIEGAQYVNPDIQVQVSFIGDFVDSAKGKELALVQYNNGVDVGFNVAGGAGLGQVDAAYETDNLVIGVDSDQAMLFADSNPEKAEKIVSSMLKQVDVSFLHAFDMWMDETIEMGTAQVFGLKLDTVTLADNKYFQDLVSEDIRTYLAEVEKKIEDGEIVVSSALNLSAEEVDAIIESAQ
ncbi:BMP family ABC transporter substrate-binding protein [Mycoplasmatota bacterium WC44]